MPGFYCRKYFGQNTCFVSKMFLNLCITKQKLCKMTTYKTVNEAFKNGTGDVFFTKNNEYVAVSRHAMDNAAFEAMEAQGFKFMTYDETLLAAATQEVEERQKKAIEQPIKVISIKKVFIQHSSYYGSLTGGFFEEYPDAYGQTL